KRRHRSACLTLSTYRVNVLGTVGITQTLNSESSAYLKRGGPYGNKAISKKRIIDRSGSFSYRDLTRSSKDVGTRTGLPRPYRSMGIPRGCWSDYDQLLRNRLRPCAEGIRLWLRSRGVRPRTAYGSVWKKRVG